MKLAIHLTKNSFSERWISYCQEKGISYKLVNCYASDIVDQVADCDALLWHHQQGNPKDILFAGQLLTALTLAGKTVFPDFRSDWHFDDKVAQKYLLEALRIEEFAKTWVFYSRAEALAWASTAVFPTVFKLRGGAGSQNVMLIKSRGECRRIINKAFGSGFSSYRAWSNLLERIRKYRIGKTDLANVMRGVARLFIPPAYARIKGRERGYVYFQEFLPDNHFDIRIIVIDRKAFALKRFVRENDFRASGSGLFRYEREEFEERFVTLAFDYSRRLDALCVAYDFVKDPQGRPRLIEINYGFAPDGYDACPGYWDEGMTWHEGKFNPYGWMIDAVMASAHHPGK